MEIFKKIKNWWDKIFALEIKLDEGADQKPEDIVNAKPQHDHECTCEVPCAVCKCKEPVTLRDAFTCYIRDCRAEKRFAEATIDSYEIIRDKHLQFIIDEKLKDLTQENVQLALNNELAKGLSATTVKKYKNVLLRIFDEYRPDFKPELKVQKD